LNFLITTIEIFRQFLLLLFIYLLVGLNVAQTKGHMAIFQLYWWRKSSGALPYNISWKISI
jgi:hypothetical protein